MKLSISLSVLSSYGQHVTDFAYKKMLDTLLSHDVKEVSVSDVKSGEFIFLDAREIEEYQVSKIPDAFWVGFKTFNPDRIPEIPENKKILVYCSVGYRSELIARQLKEQGYENVYNLYGGIFEWVNKGNEVVDSQNNRTENIHAYDKFWGKWLQKGNKKY